MKTLMFKTNNFSHFSFNFTYVLKKNTSPGKIQFCLKWLPNSFWVSCQECDYEEKTTNWPNLITLIKWCTLHFLNIGSFSLNERIRKLFHRCVLCLHLRSIHPYSNPEVLGLPVEDGSLAYMKLMDEAIPDDWQMNQSQHKRKPNKDTKPYFHSIIMQILSKHFNVAKKKKELQIRIRRVSIYWSGGINQATQSSISSDVDVTHGYNKQEVEFANYQGPHNSGQ